MATSYRKITLELPPQLLDDLDNLIKLTGLSRRACFITAIKDWMEIYKEALAQEELAHCRVARESIMRGIADAKAGRGRPWREVMSELGLDTEITDA